MWFPVLCSSVSAVLTWLLRPDYESPYPPDGGLLHDLLGPFTASTGTVSTIERPTEAGGLPSNWDFVPSLRISRSRTREASTRVRQGPTALVEIL